MVTLGTHNSRFHLDEVLSTIMLRRIYPDAKVIRTRDQAILDSCDIIYDVGGVFDEKTKRFDHHQRGFNTTFSSKHSHKLSSAGLIFKYFNEDLFSTYGYKKDEDYELIRDKIYEEYILGVDANDNGYEMEGNYQLRSLANVVNQFNKYLDEDVEFEKAAAHVKVDFDNYMTWVFEDWLIDFKYAKQCVASCDNEILVADKYVSPRSIATHAEEQQKDIKFLVLKEGEQIRIYGVPEKNSFKCKSYLKEEWRGLKDNNLVEVSGIATAKFVHASGFTGGALKVEDAIEMCIKSILN